MNILIEFCTNNYIFETDKIKDILEQDKNCEVLDYSCLGHCTECSLHPFALIEGNYFQSETPIELMNLIQEKIKELKEMDNLFDQIIKG